MKPGSDCIISVSSRSAVFPELYVNSLPWYPKPSVARLQLTTPTSSFPCALQFSSLRLPTECFCGLRTMPSTPASPQQRPTHPRRRALRRKCQLSHEAFPRQRCRPPLCPWWFSHMYLSLFGTGVICDHVSLCFYTVRSLRAMAGFYAAHPCHA